MNKLLLILYHYFFTKRRLRFSRSRLEKWQKKHKKKIINFAKNNSSFYQENIGRTISKKEMMDNFTTFNTQNIDKDLAFEIATNAEKKRSTNSKLNNITVGLSSGTSGNRGLFLASEKESLLWCGNILAKVLPKAPWYRQKIALFLRANSPLYETINSKSLKFAYFDLLEDPEILRKKVKQFAPDILVAPPSMLLLLIGYCDPKKIISVAETLFSIDEKRLEQGFGQKIHQIYQSTEGFLGFTCSHGRLHLNEDLLIIEKEYIDETRFLPILTDLFRKSQPIIRYRLDDVLEEDKSLCPCGCVFQSLKRIEGRCDDILYVQQKNGKIKPLFPDFISRRINASSPDINDYKVEQTSINHWNIYIESKFHDIALKFLNNLFNELQCIPPEISFINKPFVQKKGTKLRRIIRSYEYEYVS